MRWRYKFSLRIHSLFRKTRVERELSDELRFHLEKLIEEKFGARVARTCCSRSRLLRTVTRCPQTAARPNRRMLRLHRPFSSRPVLLS
jgi:hypothetical protein